MRIVCPGDPEWPTQVDVLGDARPLLPWVRGSTDLRFACLRSVSVVGAWPATAYGMHVAAETAAALAERHEHRSAEGHWALTIVCRRPMCRRRIRTRSGLV